MSNVRFVGLDVHAETIAVAVAETGGEVRSPGVIPNRLESVRKLVHKLGPVKDTGSSRSWVLPVRSSRRAWCLPKLGIGSKRPAATPRNWHLATVPAN
jgi:hypothetical protein